MLIFVITILDKSKCTFSFPSGCLHRSFN